MKNTENAVSFYQDLFHRFNEKQNGRFLNAYTVIREQAIQQLAETGFPTRKDEDWRFTDLRELLSLNVTLAQPLELSPEQRKTVQLLLSDAPDSIKLVFVNGFLDMDLSQTEHLPPGLHLDVHKNDLNDLHMANRGGKNAFHLLAEAFSQQGAVLRVERGKAIDRPVYILSVSVGGETPVFFAQRNRFILEPLSALTVIEQQCSLDAHAGLQIRQTHIGLEDSARLDYYTFQNENEAFYHLNQIDAEVKENANFRSHSVDFGGKLVRNTLRATLNGKGAQTTLNGLYLGNGDQHIDNHTTIEHALPHGSSRELYQGILNDRSSGVFSGMILVRPDAQQTDAQQSNNCLLLSEQAKIDSKPQLEIYADDVKCTHGATVGQLDKDEIFYLRSRGIDETAARSILTYAFAEKVIEQIQIESFKKQVEAAFNAKFKQHFNA